MSTPAQTEANQANAQKSTGPVTAEGKAIVARNALKTGLTGRTVLLPDDDADLYAKHVESFRARFNPAGDAETELVQSIADSAWRVARIPRLESAIFAVGYKRLADLHANEKDPAIRSSLIEAEVFIAYERQIRNLYTQEGRLRRQMEKDMAALKDMQQTRVSEDKNRLTKAAEALIEAVRNGQARSFDPAKIGFEFSIAQIEDKAAQMQPQLISAYRANKPRHLRNVA